MMRGQYIMDSEISLLIVLVILSGLFSGAEIAFFSLSEAKVHALMQQGRKRAKLLAYIKKDPQKLLITISIADNISDIGASALATAVAIEKFGSVGIGIATGIMTLVIMFFGEIIPKSVAQKNAASIALAAAPMVRLLMIMLYPVVWLMNHLSSFFQRLLGVHQQESSISEDEVKAMIHLSHEEGSLEENEKEMIENVFLLNDISAEDVMTPAEYIIGFDADTTLREAMSIMYESGHSRFPIYSVGESDVQGVLYLKDVFRQLSEVQKTHSDGQNKKTMEEVLAQRVSSLEKPPVFVPETMHADDLLKDFQQRRVHLAIVVDEYGAVQGLVTLEDLLEELVGEIIDETDVDTEMIERIDKQTIIVDPRVSIGQVNDFFRVSLKGSRQKTVGWLILKHFGRIPQTGESERIADCDFVIEEAEDHRVKRIRIVKTIRANK
ncbi:MAG: HlyC/CorC family transporter [Candidatus Kerfeldbacteria bacterium]|nr:HlyC/CorC family transporter [Candidatus Kerfeldbacteria bacterium]